MKSITMNTLINILLFGALVNEILYAVAGVSLIMFEKEIHDAYPGAADFLPDMKVARMLLAGAATGIPGIFTLFVRKSMPGFVPMFLLGASGVVSILTPILLNIPSLDGEYDSDVDEIAGHFVYMSTGPFKIVMALTFFLDMCHSIAPATFFNCSKFALFVNESMLLFVAVTMLRDDLKNERNWFITAGIGASIASIVLSFVIATSTSRVARFFCAFIAFLSVVGTFMYGTHFVREIDGSESSSIPGYDFLTTHLIIMGGSLVGTRIAFFFAQLPSVSTENNDERFGVTSITPVPPKRSDLPLADSRPMYENEMAPMSSNLV